MKTIFWNVDTQYDFMRDDEEHRGTLAIPGAKEIEKNLERLTRFAAQEGITVVNTADWHTPDSKEISATPDYKTTFPAHCLIGTKGAQFVPATRPQDAYEITWLDPLLFEPTFDPSLVPLARNIVLYKDDFDVFKGYPESPYADAVLDIIRPEAAFVYGVATNVCVDYAVRGLIERGVRVIVPTDAIKELPQLPLEETLRAWQDAGAILTTTDAVEGGAALLARAIGSVKWDWGRTR